jgi:hypothetical protein
MSVGTFNRLIISKAETTSGTPVTLGASGLFSYPFRGDRPTVTIEKTMDMDGSLMGIVNDGTDSIVTKVMMNMSFETDARLDSIVVLGKHCLGSLAASTGTSPNFVNSISVAQTSLQSFTLFFQDFLNATDKIWQFPLCKIQKLSIRGDAGGKIVLSCDVICGKPVDGTGAQVETSLTAANRDSWAPVTMTPILSMQNAALTVGGSAVTGKLKSFEINFENDIDVSDIAATTTLVTDIYRTAFKVSGSFTLKTDDIATSLTLMNTLVTKNGSSGVTTGRQPSTALAFTLGGAHATGTGHGAVITIPKAVLEGGNPTGQRAKMEHQFTFSGLYDTATSKSADIVVTNESTTASRYANL